MPFILIIDFQYAIIKSLGLINKLGHNYKIFFDKITSLTDNIESMEIIMYCFLKKSSVVSKITYLKSKQKNIIKLNPQRQIHN